LLLVFLTAAAPVAAQTWHRADTSNFILYSDGSASKLEEFATELEMFDALFRQYFGLSIEAPPNRLTIYLLKDSEDVGELAGSNSTAGFYRASSEGSIAVANRERGRRVTLTGQAVLQHEYVHHLMARFFTYGYPAWYREGFAEFFATAEFKRNGDWVLGQPAQYRAAGLRRVSMPLDSVLFGDRSSFSRNEVDAYYGRSWLLVHLTVFNRERREQLLQYLGQIGRGTDHRLAFEASFGDVEALDAELDSYLRGRLSALNSQSPIEIAGEVVITSLNDGQSALVPLRMYRRLGFEKVETLASLQSLAEQYPHDVDILAEIALAQRDLAEDSDEPDYATTLAAAERALAIDPDHSRMNLLKANLEIERLADAGITDDAAWDEARRLIFRSLTADSSNPLGFIAQFESFVKQGRQPPVEVVNGLGEALRLAPESNNIRVTYAYALANEGMFDDAIRLVEFLASDPHSGGLGKSVVENLRMMRAQRQALN